MTDAEQLKQALDELREISADLKMIVHEARADKRRITVLEMKVAEIDGRLLEVEDDHQNGSST